MADDSGFLDSLLNSINTGAQYGIGQAGVNGANAATQKAYAAIIQNLKDRFGDYEKLGPAGYKDITAQQLGPSALAGIQPDAQARGDEQQAIAQLGDISNRGGLDLADMNALNQIQQNLGRNNAARQNSLSNQFAARGQLGSGAQLAMELAGNQNAAMNANQAGESQAAQAQQRAMQAILQKAQASRTMGNDDYQRKAKAAEAADAIAKYNAGARTGASQYNNTIAGQNFDDSMKKLQGESGLTGSLNAAILGGGQQNANTQLANAQLGGGLINGITQGVGSLAKSLKGIGGGGSGGNGDTTDQSGTKLTDNTGGPGIDEDPGLDPSLLENPY
jgi:hypothetical protein